MVFEGLLTLVLNRFLGPYVKNLNSSQLNVGIWSGKVNLKNLELKETALTQFDIPIRVFKSQIEELHLDIPWTNLYSNPIIVKVKGVYILAGPESAIPYNREREIKEQRERKQQKLKQIEEARSSKNKGASEQDDPGFIESFITQMVRNAQVTVEDIHIHYEDKVTSPNHCFSFGVTLDNLILKSTDSKWVVQKVPADERSTQIFKVVKLDCLGVYWEVDDTLMASSGDWKETLKSAISRHDKPSPSLNYILSPLSAEAKVEVNTRPGGDLPQFSILLNLFAVALALQKEQYQEMILLVDYLDWLSISRRYRMYKPRGEYNVRNRWIFAYNAISDGEVRRKMNWRWVNIRRHRALCREYIELYTKKLTSSSPPAHVIARLLDIEDELDLFNITMCRQLAEAKADKLKEKGSESSWFSWFWGGEEKEEKEVIPTAEDLQKEKEKLYQAIGYSERGKASEYPKEYVAHVVKVYLHGVSMNLLSEKKSVAHLTISDINFQLRNRPAAKNIIVTGEVRQVVMTGTSPTGQRPQILSSNLSKDALLSFEYQMKPLESPLDHDVKVSLQPLQVIYDSFTVDRIIDLFKLPAGVRLQKTSSLASMTLNQVRTQSRIGLQYAISERSLLGLNIVIRSPVLLLPEKGVLNGAERILVMDLGSLSVVSDMKYQIPDVQEATLEELEKGAYDYFNVSLKDIHVRLTGADWEDSTQDIFKQFHVSLQLEKSIFPDDTRLPGLRINGTIDEGIEMSVPVEKIKDLMILIYTFPLPKRTAPSDISTEDYTSFDEPVDMTTSAIAETMSNLVLKKSPKKRKDAAGESDDDFETASEGEEEANAETTPSKVVTPTRKTAPGQSTTKVVVKFSLPKISVDVTSEDGSLQLLLSSLMMNCSVMSWHTEISMSLSSIAATHSLKDTAPLKILSTVDDEELLLIKVVQASSSGPYFKTHHDSVKLNVDLSVSQLLVQLSQESINHLLAIFQDIVSVTQAKPPVPPSPGEILSVKPTPAPVEGVKDLALSFNCKGMQFGLSDTAGPIVNSAVEALAVNVALSVNEIRITTSLENLMVTDADPNSTHPKVISTNSQPLANLTVTIHKTPIAEGDIFVTAGIERTAVVITLEFVKRLLKFARGISIEKEFADTTKSVATEKAVVTVKQNKSKRIKLNVTIAAPVVTVPVSDASFVLNMGDIRLTNKFELLSKYYDISSLLSAEDSPPLADVMDLSVNQLQIYRTSESKSHDRHVILSPVTLKGNVVRRMSSCGPHIPTVSVGLNPGNIEVSFNPGDYRAVMALIKDLPTTPSSDKSVSSSSDDKSKADKLKGDITQPQPVAELSTLLSLSVSLDSFSLSVESEALQETVIATMSILELSTTLKIDTRATDINLQVKSLKFTDPQSTVFSEVIKTIEHSRALDGQITLYKATVADNEPDVGLDMKVGEHSVTASVPFINTILNFVKELQAKETTDGPTVVEQKSGISPEPPTTAVAKQLPPAITNGKRIELKAVIGSQQVMLVPSVTSSNVFVARLGNVSLSNEIHEIKNVSSLDQNPVYEEYKLNLSSLELHRSLWSLEKGKLSADDKSAIFEMGSTEGTLIRNVSSGWYNGIPSFDIKLSVPQIQLHWSADDSNLMAGIMFAIDIKKKDSSSLKKGSPPTQPAAHAITPESGTDDFVRLKFELCADKIAANLSDTKTQAASIGLNQINCSLILSSTDEVKSKITVTSMNVDDARPDTSNATTAKRLLGTTEGATEPIVALTFSQDPVLCQRIGSVTVSNPRVILNTEYIIYLLNYVKTLYEPFLRVPAEKKTVSAPEAVTDEKPSAVTDGAESAISDEKPGAELAISEDAESSPSYSLNLTASIVKPQLVLVADPDSTEDALVAQAEVHVQFSMREGRLSLFVSLSECTMFTGPLSQTEVEKKNVVLTPCEISMSLSGKSTDKSIMVFIKRVELFVAPSTVRLLFKLVRTIQSSTAGEELKVTVPVDLWKEKPVDQSRWYFQSPTFQDPILALMSTAETTSQNKGEFLTLDIEQVSIILLQEHPRTHEVSSAFSILLGSYGRQGMKLKMQEWTGELWAEADLSLTASYFNTYTDVWEPLLEPAVDIEDDTVYSPWALTATVEKAKVSNGVHELKASIESATALQLTISSTGINLLSGIVETYLGDKVQLLRLSEETDSLPLEDSGPLAVIISNHIGKEYLVKLKTKKNIKLSAQSNLNLEYQQSTVFVREECCNPALPGEILPSNERIAQRAIVSVQVTGYQEIDITVNESGKDYYLLRPTGKADRLPIVVETNKVYASDPSEITLRSPLQLNNHLSVPIDVYWGEETDKSSTDVIMKVLGETCSPVPLPYATKGHLFLKPSSANAVSHRGVSWHSVSSSGINLHSQPMWIHVNSELEQYSNRLSVPSDAVHHVLHLYYPFVLHNYLPDTLIVQGNAIASGGHMYLSDVNPSRDTKLKLEMKSELDGDKMLGHAHIDDSMETKHAKMTDVKDSRDVVLTFRRDDRGGANHISIFCANWMINKTGFVLEYSHKGFWGTREDPVIHDKEIDLVLFSEDEVSVRAKAPDGQWSKWSKCFSLNTVGSEGVLSCAYNGKTYQFGITCHLASFSLTKVITISPFYVLSNQTEDIITVLELEQPLEKTVILKPQEVVNFWPESKIGQLLIDVLDEPSLSTWSSPFKYNVTGAYFIKLNSAKVSAVSVHVAVSGSASVISFLPYYRGAVPIQLVNTLPYGIDYAQSNKNGQPVFLRTLEPGESRNFTWDDPNEKQALLWKVVGNKSFTNFIVKDSHGKTILPVGTDITESSSSEAKKEDESKGIQLKKQFVGVAMATTKLMSKKKAAQPSDTGYWVSFTDDLQRVLLFTPDKSVADVAAALVTTKDFSFSAKFSILAVGLSLVNNRKGIEVAYIGLPQSEVIWELEKVPGRWKPVEGVLSTKLEEIYNDESREKVTAISKELSIEFVSKEEIYLKKNSDEKKLLRRSYFNGFTVDFKKTKQLTSVNLKINKIQIDNQLPLTQHPTIFYAYPPPPTIASKFAPKPFLELSLVLKNNQDIHFLQVLIQEMGVIVDLDFLLEVVALFEFLGKREKDEKLMEQQKALIRPSLTESQPKAVNASPPKKIFFKFIHLSPLDIHVTFSLDISEKKKKEISFLTDQNWLLQFVLDILYTFVGFIGKAKDAELKLDYFELQERTLTVPDLRHHIIDHYKQEFLFQLYSVVFGLEVLGNPVGFLRGLTEGTVDLFYQPIQGAVLGPEEFVEGLALGTHQFIGGTVGGIVGIGARVTGVIGDGLALLTFDSQYQERRPEQQSFGQGLERLGKGFYHGVTGVVLQPIKGAKKEGFLGFVKGAGKGVMGLVFKPTGGLVDFASATLLAVQKTTQVGDYELRQLRVARFIAIDKVIRPYSIYVATGYAVFLDFENGRLYGGHQFVGHVELQDDPMEMFVATDQKLMILKKSDFFKKWECEWSLSLKIVFDDPSVNGKAVVYPIWEEQHSGFLGFGGKKIVKSTTKLNFSDKERAERVCAVSKEAFQLSTSNS